MRRNEEERGGSRSRPKGTVATVAFAFPGSMLIAVSFSISEHAERGEEGGHELCELQDDDHHPLETEPKRRASLQRLRAVLQAAQRKWHTV